MKHYGDSPYSGDGKGYGPVDTKTSSAISKFFAGDSYTNQMEGDDLGGDLFGDEYAGDDFSGDSGMERALALIGDALDLDGDYHNMMGDAASAATGKNPALKSQLQARFAQLKASGQTAKANKLKQAVKVVKQLPPNVSAATYLPPYILKNANMVQFVTHAMMSGGILAEFIARYQSQLIGSSRFATTAGAGLGNVTQFNFAAGTPTEVAFAGPMLITLQSSNLNAIDDLTMGMSIPSAVTETGQPYTSFGLFRFAVKRKEKKDGKNAVYIFVFPFKEVATRLFPIALRAQAAPNDLMIYLHDVPTDYVASIYLLAPDNQYWNEFKVAFGFAKDNEVAVFK